MKTNKDIQGEIAKRLHDDLEKIFPLAKTHRDRHNWVDKVGKPLSHLPTPK